MIPYFNLNIEFNHSELLKSIDYRAKSAGKGYVCVIDANVLTMAQTDLDYRNVINEAFINTCDGSSIAMMAGWIHHQKFRALNGPTIFSNYIEQPIKQLLLGSTVETSTQIKKTLENKGINSDHISVMPLPFRSVADFDYLAIAGNINKIAPDIIWVSLGAPKQELFMNQMLPYLDKGVMFGIGAAFNFYVGAIGMPKTSIGGFRFIWLSRLISEPKKLIRRIIPYLLIIPRLYFDERKKVVHIRRMDKTIKTQ